MEFVAKSKNIRVSPRKIRLIVAALKKLPPAKVMEKLTFTARSASLPVLKTLQSAIANATQTGKVKVEDLKIKNILVDEGIKMKRRDTSHRPGREGLIQKRTSHITVILSER